ncbi:hypothetical protein AAC387_Pa09g0426 [Persea americana]
MRTTPYTTSLHTAKVQSETKKENGREQAEDKTQSNSEPEFTNFDKDRTESQFASDQIWATYDTNARKTLYGRIKRIISEQSELDVIWLQPCPDPDNQDEVDWV